MIKILDEKTAIWAAKNGKAAKMRIDDIGLKWKLKGFTPLMGLRRLSKRESQRREM
jgi:hypothetical protein